MALLFSRRAVSLQPHCRCASASPETAWRVFGGNFMGEHYKEKNVRKWKESLQDRRKQFAREAIHERYEKIVANRVVSRVPHLRSVHRQRLLNFVELENARVAAYRKYETQEKMKVLNEELEEASEAEREDRDVADINRRERIEHFQNEGFVTLEGLDDAVDAALDNPVGFGSALTRQGHRVERQVEARTTTTSTADAEEFQEEEDPDEAD
ncbi:small ribosomal subunit protein mS26-like [Sycon ciliatum]|uniref:small ribosomal subunit protein mS26-like n=1 Tax=Sycon ciliatum TaxID=27933 RepID=UPI0020A8956D|eukprot:scpid88248/ scgid19213/ 